VLRVDRENAVIVGGLEAGERVCISTLEAVSDGMKVRTAGGERSGGEAPAAGPSGDREAGETANAGGTR
jgi:hypothetical protein